MKKITALVLFVMMIFTSLSLVPAFAAEADESLTSSGLTVVFGKYVLAAYPGIARDPNATGKAAGLTDKVIMSNSSPAIPRALEDAIVIDVQEAGYYDAELIMGYSTGKDYGEMTVVIKNSSDETILSISNQTVGSEELSNFYKTNYDAGLKASCSKIYKYDNPKVYLEEGEYTLNTVHTIAENGNYRFALHNIKFTAVDLAPVTVTGRNNDKLDVDKWLTEEISADLVTIKEDANAMGGEYGYSNEFSRNAIIIPIDVKKATYYDIEYILGQPSDDSYSGWSLYLDGDKISDSNSSGTYAGLTSVNEAFPMKDFKNEHIYLDEGIHTIKLVINANTDGKRTFAADYIAFIPYAVEGEASTVIDNFKIIDGVVTVEGRILNSIGKGYEGLKADIYLTLPDSDPVKINEDDVISDAEGKFSLSYTLPEDDVNGMCKAEVVAEYAESAEETYEYMSAKYLLPILDEFKETADAKGVFDSHRAQLGVDDIEDTKGLTDADLFYDAFEGKSLANLEEFRTFYAKTLLKEKINQAESMDDVKAIITNDDNARIIGLDLGKLSALSNDGIEYTAGALYDLERVDEVSDFKEEFEDVIFNEALLFQFGIGIFELKTHSESVKQGQTTELNIKANSAMDNVRKIELTIAFEGALNGEYDELEFTTELGERVEIKDLTYEITPEEVTDGVTDIANISFIPEKVGEGKVKVEGKVTLDNTTDYDAVADITPIEYTVAVSEQVKESIGGGSSSGRGSGGGGISFGATTVVPVPQTGVQQTQVKSYKDLDSVPWAEEAIVGLYNRQAIAMPEDGMFNPNRTITRAEFIKMVILANYMWRGAALENDFNDVNKDDWYYQYLVSAVNNKLITGDSENNFRPNDPITREDICVILARVKKVKNADMLLPFADDADISEYAKVAVYYMQEAGIVNGVGDGRFAPKANATRAEAAKIIYGTVK